MQILTIKRKGAPERRKPKGQVVDQGNIDHPAITATTAPDTPNAPARNPIAPPRFTCCANACPHCCCAMTAALSYVFFSPVRTEAVEPVSAASYRLIKLFVHEEHETVVLLGRLIPRGSW